MHQHRRPLAFAAGLVIAAAVVAVIVDARGGSSYDLRFGTAFSDGESLALVAAAAVAAGLLAGIRWAAALLVLFGVLVVALGVLHPCRIAFQNSPQLQRCTVSASAAAIGLYLPFGAVLCAAAAGLASRLTPTRIVAASLLAGAAAVLAASLLGPWYAATDDGHDYSQTGWQAFQRFDVLLVVVAAIAAAVAVMALRAGSRAAARPLGPAVSLLACSGAGIVFYRLFTSADPPSGGYAPLAAAFVALGALALIAFAALVATRD